MHIAPIANPAQSLALEVLRAFPEVPAVQVMREVKCGDAGHVYQFTGYVFRGEYIEDVYCQFTMTRRAGSIVVEATDENDDYYYGGSLAEVIDQLVFEHGGSHGEVFYVG